jgi:hypothetical protein
MQSGQTGLWLSITFSRSGAIWDKSRIIGNGFSGLVEDVLAFAGGFEAGLNSSQNHHIVSH